MQGMVSPKKHIKATISLVGETAVGKTSLVKRFVLDTFADRYVATVGTKVTKKTVPVVWRGLPARMDLMVWDIMGEKGFRALLKEAYFDGAQGILAVCDIRSEERREGIESRSQWTPNHYRKKPMVFLGNKVDLRDRAELTS